MVEAARKLTSLGKVNILKVKYIKRPLLRCLCCNCRGVHVVIRIATLCFLVCVVPFANEVFHYCRFYTKILQNKPDLG
jgi:hypothetical protein